MTRSASGAPKLALIAGSGDLPIRIAARCEAEGRAVFIIRLAGESATLVESCSAVS